MESVLPLALVLLGQWAPALPSKDGAPSELLRRYYEAGVRYVDAPVATASSPCLADDWSVVLDWGDGAGTSPPSRRDAPTVPCGGSGCVPKGGPYPLWTDHVYAKPGKYSVRIEPRIHCFGTHGGAVPYPAGFVASVFRRIPLARISLLRSTVAAGDTVALRVQLAESAPPSGTRVFLRAVSGGLTGLPAFVDVKSREETVEFVVGGPPGTATIEATTVPDRPLDLKLRIRAKR